MGEESIPESPRRHHLGPIGRDWIPWFRCRGSWDNESRAFSVSIVESRFCWEKKKKEWLETGRKRQLGMMSNCLYPKMKHSFLALLKFGKTRTQLLRKDSHTPTKKNNLRWCSGSGPKTVPSDDVIFWSRTSDRLETRTGRSQSHSEQRGTTLSVFRRLQRLATKSRLESGEAGLLNSAN